MASWLPETLFEIVGQGPAPSKDYYQLLVTRSQSSLRAKRKSRRPRLACSGAASPPRGKQRKKDSAKCPEEEPAGEGRERGYDLSSRVIFRWWKISLRSEYRSAKPGETKDSHGAFLENSHLQEMKEGREEKRKFGGVQIALIFGARILDYVFNLCEGKFDFLERLSDNLLLSIISYLDLEDIARLSQTSRRFAKPFKQETQKPLKYHAGK
ncbi:F-box only protein 36 isoform X3 [Canis aureus]